MDKEFLEKYPLYRKFTDLSFNQWTELQDIRKPAVHMDCSTCESPQTFSMRNEYYEVDYPPRSQVAGKVFRLKYCCTACNTALRFFFIYASIGSFKERDEQTGELDDVEKLFVMKVGQIPAWDISMDKELEGMLGDHADVYRKGLVSESQNYGIGAYAYFRRIAEDIMDELLESILDLVPIEEKGKYEQQLVKVKAERNTENKIDLVKDLLPESLKVDGMNPLKELYSVLSDGIHNLSDEECVEKAEAIREILIFLVNQVLNSKNQKKKFTESMKKLLNK